MKKINIYFFALLLLCFKNWIYFSKIINFDIKFDKILSILICLLFFIKIVSTRYEKKELIKMLIVGLILLINSYLIKEYIFLIDFLALIASKNISLKKIVKIIFIFNVFMILIHLIFTLFGILNGSSEYYNLLDGVKRMNFYLRHTNSAAAMIFWTLAMYIYLKKSNSKIYNIMLLIIFSVITYYFTKSRTTIILYISYILLIILNENEFILKIMVKYLFFILAVFLTFVTINFFDFNNKIYSFLLVINDLLSYRLILGAVGYQIYGMTLFGKSINYYLPINSNGFYLDELVLDSFPISCLINYGIIIIILLILAFFDLSKKINNNEMIYVLLIIILSLSERYIPYICMAFPIIFLRYSFFENTNLKK